MNFKKYICEFIGTAVLVLFGCGAALISGNIVATALAFGLSIIAMAYVIGDISGCHVNPAVSLAMLINKKMTITDFIGYVVAQILGAFAGSGILYFLIHSSNRIAEAATQKGKSILEIVGLGTNGFDEISAIGINMWAALVVEIVLTFVFIYTILGVTSDKNKSSIAGIVIGLTLAFVHILGINLTGTSVNPARSLAPAVITGGIALQQVWVFIVAPLLGSILASIVFKLLNKEKQEN